MRGQRAVPRACAACGTKTVRRKWCESCALAKGKEMRAAWHAARPERLREAQRRFRERHPERVKKRLVMFGVTEGEFARRLAEQGGRCGVCGTNAPGPGGWNLDHDHEKGAKDKSGHRGVLCRACNLMLGNARDRESVLERGVMYLCRYRIGVRLTCLGDGDAGAGGAA